MSCVAVSIVLASGAGAGCASEPEHRTAETSSVEIDTISSFDISAGGRKFRVHGAAQLGGVLDAVTAPADGDGVP